MKFSHYDGIEKSSNRRSWHAQAHHASRERRQPPHVPTLAKPSSLRRHPELTEESVGQPEGRLPSPRGLHRTADSDPRAPVDLVLAQIGRVSTPDPVSRPIQAYPDKRAILRAHRTPRGSQDQR